MRKKIDNKKSLVLVTVTLFLTTFGCQTKDKSMNTQSDHPTSMVLHINNQGDLASLNPHTGLDLPCRIFQKALFEGLTRIGKEDKGMLALATHYEISEDNKEYTFHLRPSQWTNGEWVTAHHFKKSWVAALTPNSSCMRADLFYPIKNAKKVKMGEVPMDELGVTAVDDSTLVVTLEHPTPYLLELLANPIFSPLYDTDREPSVFNGPFVIDSYERQQQIILKKNPLYWDQEHVYLDKIVTSFVQDPSTAVMLYEKGELDWVGAPFTMLPVDFIKEAEKSNQFVSKPISAVHWYCCNMSHPPLNSKKIRQALSTVLNREDLCEHVLLGESSIKGILPLGLTLLQEDEFYKDNNLAEAQKLFNEGLEELGMTKESLEPLELTYSDIAGQKKLAAALQQIWEEAFGIKVKLLYTEWNVFFTDLVTKQYQIAGCIWFTAFQDAIYHLDHFRYLNNRLNVVGWENTEYQNLLNLADHETDLHKRADHLRKAELLILEEMPVIPIYQHHSKYLVSEKVKGAQFSSLGQVDLKGVYFEQKP